MTKSHLKAFALSIIPGLGLVYVHGFRKAWKHVVFFWTMIALSIILFSGLHQSIVLTIIWIYSACDAAQQAVSVKERIPMPEWAIRRKHE